MKIDEHIKNLEEYCQEDDLFEKDGDFKEFCDNHIADIKAVLQELENTRTDLYEANNRITDLLLILGDRDRMIDLMAQAIDNYDSQLEINSYRDKDEIIEAFKEAMARRDFREKKRKEFEERCKNAKN
jgi:hypothetical protein